MKKITERKERAGRVCSLKDVVTRITAFTLAVTAALLLMFTAWPQRTYGASAPTITVKAVSKLSGTNAQINATISNPSRIRLKKCGFVLYDQNGAQLTDRYDAINYTMTSFNGWYDMNEYYGKLQPGATYQYKFYVMDASGNYYFSSVNNFSTSGQSAQTASVTVTDQGVTKLSATDAQINASISDPSKIRLVRCGYHLYDGNGNLLSDRFDTINYTMASFNGWFDMNEYYGQLSPSTTYTYDIYVMDASGNTYSTGKKSFTTQAGQVSAPAADGGSKTLSYDPSVIKDTIGCQPNGSSYCSVYAISYARAVAGKTPYADPLKYWKEGAGAAWSWGGMSSKKYNSQQGALKRVYDEINAGRPAIVYVYGPGAVQHYVTVIGYTDVWDANNLQMGNFQILDPGYGYACQRSLGVYTGMKATSNGFQVVVF